MCCGGPLKAATPVASIVGTEPLEVSGVVVPALHRVPVALDDDVLTRNNAAVMRFQDGSEIVLQPNSRVRLENSNGTVAAHIVSGSATYKIAPRSKLKIIDSKHAVVNSMLDHVSTEINAAVASDKLAQGAVAYRASAAHGTGMVLPANAISYGKFTSGTKGAIIAPNGGSRIMTPSGVQIEVTTVNGQLVITNVLVPITNPVTGQIQYLQVDGFNGATLAITTPDASGQSGLTITLAGQTTPLTPAQTQAALQSGTASSFNGSLTSGQLPQNTLTPSQQSVNAGTFSPSAP
jgi:hypothetical protein